MPAEMSREPLRKQFPSSDQKSVHSPSPTVELTGGRASHLCPSDGHTFVGDPVVAIAGALAPGPTYQEHSVDVQPQRNGAQLASPPHTGCFLPSLSLGT